MTGLHGDEIVGMDFGGVATHQRSTISGSDFTGNLENGPASVLIEVEAEKSKLFIPDQEILPEDAML
jgi:hypothetical protein